MDTEPSNTEADLAPSIPAHWDLITAGDGVTYWPEDTAQLSTYRWAPVGTYTGNRGKSDAEILTMGEVRRAVVITVPEHDEGYNPVYEDALEYVEVYGSEKANEYAAGLIAAALHAEEGEK